MFIKIAAVLLVIIAVLYFLVGWLMIGKACPRYSFGSYVLEGIEALLILIVAGHVLNFW